MPNFAKKVRLRGVFYWEKCDAVASTNVTVANMYAGATVDGVTLTAGMTLGLVAQTTGTENGVYNVLAATSAPTRKRNWQVGDSVVGYALRAMAGTSNKNKVWAAYAEPAVIGTNDPQFIVHERI